MFDGVHIQHEIHPFVSYRHSLQSTSEQAHPLGDTIVLLMVVYSVSIGGISHSNLSMQNQAIIATTAHATCFIS